MVPPARSMPLRYCPNTVNAPNRAHGRRQINSPRRKFRCMASGTLSPAAGPAAGRLLRFGLVLPEHPGDAALEHLELRVLGPEGEFVLGLLDGHDGADDPRRGDDLGAPLDVRQELLLLPLL